MQPIAPTHSATRLRPGVVTRLSGCITIRPRHFCLLPLTFAISACESAPSDVGVLTCTAERECIGESCSASDLEFNIGTNGASDVRLNFVDGSFELDFVETTVATSSEGDIRLTTYEIQSNLCG